MTYFGSSLDARTVRTGMHAGTWPVLSTTAGPVSMSTLTSRQWPASRGNQKWRRSNSTGQFWLCEAGASTFLKTIPFSYSVAMTLETMWHGSLCLQLSGNAIRPSTLRMNSSRHPSPGGEPSHTYHMVMRGSLIAGYPLWCNHGSQFAAGWEFIPRPFQGSSPWLLA